MAKWVLRGEREGKKQKWELEAKDADAVRRIALAKGIVVLSIAEKTDGVSSTSITTVTTRAASVPAVAPVVQPIRRVERCANCDAPIGRLEKPLLWNDSIVCMTCHSKFTTIAIPSAHQPLAAVQPVQPQVIMMQAPAQQAGPVIHVSNTNVNKIRVQRGCLGSLVHGIFMIIAVIIFIVGAVALVAYLKSR